MLINISMPPWAWRDNTAITCVNETLVGRHMFAASQAAGIEFASATVSVQAVGGQVDLATAAGAAAGAAGVQDGRG
jgi:hypothetical protein